MSDGAESRLVHREFLMLAALSVAAIVLFSAAKGLAATSRAEHAAAAKYWYDAGRKAADTNVKLAVADFRKAVTGDPRERRYALALADALVRAGQIDEAETALLRLRSAQLDDTDANLQLARISARRRDLTAASRFYRAALDGMPPLDPRQMLDVRLELSDFLLNESALEAAISQLVIAGAESTSADDFTKVGDRMLRAGETQRAAGLFARARNSKSR